MKLARRRASFAPKGTIGEGTFFPGSSFRQSNQAVSRQAAALQTGKERSHLKPSHTNERKESFCAHYVLTGNPEEAARLAGYPPEEAAAAGLTLLRQCSIQRSIQSLQRAYLEGRLSTAGIRQRRRCRFPAAQRRGAISSAAAADGSVQSVCCKAGQKWRCGTALLRSAACLGTHV